MKVVTPMEWVKWTIPVKIKKLNEYAKIPTQGSAAAAGYDVYAAISKPIQVLPHRTAKIGLGFAMEVQENYFVGIFARSGLATKQGLRPANCVGIIDPDYRGEVTVVLYNDSNVIKVINPGERIGQLVIMPRFSWSIKEVKELSDTDRDTGGFGSTGK